MNLNLAVALVAVILAAVAFVVSFLQLLLEYMSSSASRNICNYSAIGPTASQTRYSWDFRAWKLRVQYPLIRLEPDGLLGLSMLASRETIDRNKFIRTLVTNHKGWLWRTRKWEEEIDNNDLADDFNVLMGTDANGSRRIISSRDLSWSEWVHFKIYRLRHPLRALARPRSSWAQMISMLGIKDTKGAFVRHIDAETVPTGLDTPVQHIKLRDMGEIAFILGFQSVELDIPNRTFRALGRLGTITTHSDNVLGQFLRFQGDTVSIRSLVGRCMPDYIYRARRQIQGTLSFGKYIVATTFYPLGTLALAIKNNAHPAEYNLAERNDAEAGRLGYDNGAVYMEAGLMKKYLSKMLFDQKSDQNLAIHLRAPTNYDPIRFDNVYRTLDDRLRDILIKDREEFREIFERCIMHWQVKSGCHIPTIYVASTFASIHSVVCGYPGKALLLPFLPWVRQRAQRLFDNKSSSVRVSLEFAKEVSKGELQTFSRETSAYLMDTGSVPSAHANGVYGWGTTNMEEIFELLPTRLQEEVVPKGEKREANAVLLPDTAKLLRRYELDRWATSVREARQSGSLDYHAINGLWIQIAVLDLAIQYLLHGGWAFRPMHGRTKEHLGEVAIKDYHRVATGGLQAVADFYGDFFNESWGKEEGDLVTAIVNSWKIIKATNSEDQFTFADEDDDMEAVAHDAALDPPDHDIAPWDLSTALTNDTNLVLGKDLDTGPARSALCEKLAELLELRAIVVFAYLFLHPDTSDIYESYRKEDDIEMPII